MELPYSVNVQIFHAKVNFGELAQSCAINSCQLL